MNGRQDEEELAAIAAAYAIVTRARAVTERAAPEVPRWRLAGRIAIEDAPAARERARRSAWRSATGP